MGRRRRRRRRTDAFGGPSQALPLMAHVSSPREARICRSEDRRARVAREEGVELLGRRGRRRLRIGAAELGRLDGVRDDLVDLGRHARLGAGAGVDVVREDPQLASC